jgi:integrase
VQADEAEHHPADPQHPVRAFDTARRWEWVDFNPADSARPPTASPVKHPATPPGDVARVIAQARAEDKLLLALYIWLAAITGARRGELCALQIGGIDLENKALHIGFSYVVRDGHKLRKDTKTHQDRWIALDDTSCAFIEVLTGLRPALARAGLALPGWLPTPITSMTRTCATGWPTCWPSSPPRPRRAVASRPSSTRPAANSCRPG